MVFSYDLLFDEQETIQPLIQELTRKHGAVTSWEFLTNTTFYIKDTGMFSYQYDHISTSRTDARAVELIISINSRDIATYDTPVICKTILSVYRNFIPANVGYDLKKVIFNIDMTIQPSQQEHITLLENLDVFEAATMKVLSDEMIKSFKLEQYDVALDRLHTFTHRFIRELCEKHELSYTKEDAIHSLLAKYTRHLTDKELVQSEMTVTILKSNISILNNFNQVRNNQTLAHDNMLLNKSESQLITSTILSILTFIRNLEMENSNVGKEWFEEHNRLF